MMISLNNTPCYKKAPTFLKLSVLIRGTINNILLLSHTEETGYSSFQSTVTVIHWKGYECPTYTFTIFFTTFFELTFLNVL